MNSMTWRDGFEVTCNECGKTKELFYDPDYADQGIVQLEMSKKLEKEGWTNPDYNYHLCPDCARKTELEEKIESILPKKSWITEVIERLMP